ncbi:hypothetical protein NLJ89_g9646 [Agrocybe chaxingu]|uniref:Glycoside hydrolase family 88 protein n=1 Tax=Agrocybe chaxingu TaxID=84603 RepID=A0A9W8JSB1_9AGAR|nr:hypothetical protein NLJ89_g9646 [Agrocybe chaxingu]
MLLQSLLLAVLATSTLAQFPPELFSPLIPSKILATTNALPNPIQYPQYTDARNPGRWLYFSPNTWTSGFFPVTLYELNTRRQRCGVTQANGLGVADWLALGRAASNGLLNLNADTGIGHDVGFISFPFVEELAINPRNQTAIDAINRFARQLAARFNPTVGCTRSWDSSNPTNFQVIIDQYDEPRVYRLTRNPNYLATARRMATYFLNNLPADGIVPWDFNAPLTPAPRPADSSAATLVVNALLLLSEHETTEAAKQQWISGALRILEKITDLAWSSSWQSLLSNGTVSLPGNNFLTGIVYGDYYFIRAGNELVRLGLTSCRSNLRPSPNNNVSPQPQTSSGRRSARVLL